MPADPRPDPLLRAALLATLLLTPQPATAGVEVVADAARTGNFGLQADVRPACTDTTTLHVTDPVDSHLDIESCNEVIVEAAVQPTGDLVVTAGERVTFRSGFSVAQGGRLVARTISDWRPSYVIDDSAAGEHTARVEWFGSFDRSTTKPGQRVVFLGVYTNTDLEARAVYESATFGGRAWVELVGKEGVLATGEPATVTPGWHRFELYWREGTPEVGEGAVLFGVDQQQPDTLALDALSTATIESIHLGVVDASAAGGTIDLDDYAVSRLD